MKILSLNDRAGYEHYTSVHALLNVHYVVSKLNGKQSSRESIKLLSKKLNVVQNNKELFEEALYSEFQDLEDAVQFVSAKSIDAKAIITRNVKDYKLSTIPVLTAEQFLRTL